MQRHHVSPLTYKPEEAREIARAAECLHNFNGYDSTGRLIEEALRAERRHNGRGRAAELEAVAVVCKAMLRGIQAQREATYGRLLGQETDETRDHFGPPLKLGSVAGFREGYRLALLAGAAVEHQGHHEDRDPIEPQLAAATLMHERARNRWLPSYPVGAD